MLLSWLFQELQKKREHNSFQKRENNSVRERLSTKKIIVIKVFFKKKGWSSEGEDTPREKNSTKTRGNALMIRNGENAANKKEENTLKPIWSGYLGRLPCSPTRICSSQNIEALYYLPLKE